MSKPRKSRLRSFVANTTAVLFGTASGLMAGTTIAFLLWHFV